MYTRVSILQEVPIFFTISYKAQSFRKGKTIFIILYFFNAFSTNLASSISWWVTAQNMLLKLPSGTRVHWWPIFFLAS